MTSSRLGISLPPYIGPRFDEVWDLAERGLGRDSQAFRLFSMGWHGVGYRAVTLGHYAHRHSRLPKYGSSGHEGNYLEDQALVDYLFNACSAVDCLVFAAFGVASGLAPDAFPSNARKLVQVRLQMLAEEFENTWSGEELTALFKDLRDHSGIRFLYKVRDVVTHRGALPRTLTNYWGEESRTQVTIPSKIKEIPDLWTSDFPIDSTAVADWQKAIELTLARAVAGFQTFAPLRNRAKKSLHVISPRTTS